VNIDGSGVMVDFSAGHIETPFTGVVIGELRKKVEGGGIELFAGVSYRNILIWRDYPHGEIAETTPPHDIQGREIRSYLPKGCGAEKLNEIMELSRKVISGSEAIREEKSRYRGDPTSAWLWGGGWRPAMESLADRYGLRGHTIAAVDLIHGIGRAAGLTPIEVPGATGYIDTNYEGKADALIEAFRDASFVFLHVEAPDESGHEGNLEHKIQAIEDFDARVVGRVMEKMKKYEDYTILVMPDHPTPLSLRTHTADPVPFCIYNSRKAGPGAGGVSGYNEREASRTGVFVTEGHRLIEIMIKGGL
jgi:2,3-bisphosphoglycerate-independent phosphoglycerate mutase